MHWDILSNFCALVKIFELYERAWKVRQISLNCELSYRHHWDWVIQDYKERQLQVQKNLNLKQFSLRLNSFIKKRSRQLQLKIECLEEFWQWISMSIYSSEKLGNVYELSQVVSQNSSRSNRWLFFDFSVLYQLEHQNILYTTTLWKKPLFVFKTMTVNFHWIFNCAFAYNKLKGRADSSPNLEIINLVYDADVKINDLFLL